MARNADRAASSYRPARNRRSKRRDRHGVAASRGCLRGVPLCHRARQADRPGVETRVLRRRRRVDRRRDGGSRRSGRARGSRANRDRKSTRLNSSHLGISYAVFCLKKKKRKQQIHYQTATSQNKRKNTNNKDNTQHPIKTSADAPIRQSTRHRQSEEQH